MTLQHHPEVDTPTWRIPSVPFESVEPVFTPQGHRIRPLIDGRPDGNAPGMKICAGGLDVPAGFIANAHRHPESDVIVYVESSGDEGAITVYGPNLEFQRRQFAGEVLPIRRGWAHVVVNPSLTTPIRAIEFRGNTTVVVDNPLAPELQPIADARGYEILVHEHGQETVDLFRAGKLPTSTKAQLTTRFGSTPLPVRTDWVVGRGAPYRDKY